ncbi:hypothetical protein SAMN02745857_03529 [Andreprevotia lacus DSM 23236]|jgi:hypothetical protein|uniref:Uncharacterized protein n=1 Tax=Andreprevotia lacus DSM 23236 TaxID=1121001 RepID=A0A1W1XYF0_9NEIS|nr:hypothetical protein [Andreprevotia lacus]SMC28989.1 hypothetical protein SAMN02745857_03529 [Andreprevotia lacus DSM 23236]
MDQALNILVARLLAHRFIPRRDPLARRALIDETFRASLDHRLEECGLLLLENPYAEHIAVGLKPEMEEWVFGEGDNWLSNNMGLPRDAIALLVVVWALIILPKRERQIARAERSGDTQSDMFGAEKPIAHGEEMAPGVPEDAIYADFGKKLGGKARFSMNLGQLAKLGFVIRRNKLIHEGPLLDLMIDYARLAPRIIEGALGEVLQLSGTQIAVEPVTEDLLDAINDD